MAKPTNFLFIMADEHQRAAAGCYGHQMVKTPNLDALAARGTRFTQAYTNCPICVPARASFMTGRYVHRIGHWDNAHPYDGAVPSWGRRLQQAGHRTTSVGKLHFRSDDDPTGFDEQLLAMHVAANGGDILGSVRDELPRRDKKKIATEIGAGDTTYIRYDRATASEAARWLVEDAPKYGDKPWVTYISFVCPHYPLVAPPEYFAMYPTDKIDLPAKASDHPYDAAYRESYAVDVHFADDEARKVGIAAYYGLCSFIDDQLGKVLAALREAGLEDSTTVIYTSDHGESLGTRGMWGKSTMYEESVAIPMVLAGPDVAQGAVVETPVSLVDLYPTILESAGLALDETEQAELAGRSLFATAAAPAEPDRPIFSEYHAVSSVTGCYMLKRGRYKLIYYAGLAPQLFDLETDPEEANNLAADPDHAAILAELEQDLRRICDPEAMDAAAKASQQALVDKHGGRDALVGSDKFSGSPLPSGL